MDRPALRRILLDLFAAGQGESLSALGEADWQQLDLIAAQHRLQPQLFVRHRDNPLVPEAVRIGWQAAHRLSAMTAMAQRAELAETFALLEGRGFAPIVLKGGWLAAHAYADPAERPLRDLDLLVEPEHVLAAFDALLAAGYVEARSPEMSPADALRLDKHMVPLLAPRGTVVELHHRLWERDGRLDHATPAGQDDAIRARAIIAADGLRYPAPPDMLAHLIVHAVYSHRLDCGPLVLSDIDRLLRVSEIDWAAFWADAAAQGWRDGARFLLGLAARYMPGSGIDFTADQGPPPPPHLIDAAPDLLLQDLDARRSAGFAAATIRHGRSRLLARLTRQRGVAGEAPADLPGGSAGLASWAASRLAGSVRDLARRDVRLQARRLADLSTWLDR